MKEEEAEVKVVGKKRKKREKEELSKQDNPREDYHPVFDIEEWKGMDNLPIDASIVAYGMRRSGKSVLFKHIIKTLSHRVNGVVVVSGTEEANDYYKEFIPQDNIHYKWSDAIWEQIKERQTSMAKEDPRRPIVLLGDDLQSKRSNRKSESMDDAYMMGRHYGVVVLWTT